MNILVIKPKMPMTQLTRADEFLLLFSLIIVLALAAVFLIVLSRPGAHLRPPTFQERWDALPGVDALRDRALVVRPCCRVMTTPRPPLVPHPLRQWDI